MITNEGQRLLDWSSEAVAIIDAIRKYEAEHPKGALCLAPMLEHAERCRVSWHGIDPDEREPNGFIGAMHEGKSGWDDQSLYREHQPDPDFTGGGSMEGSVAWEAEPTRNFHADCADQSLCASRSCEVYLAVKRSTERLGPTGHPAVDQWLRETDAGRSEREVRFFTPPPALTLEQRVRQLEEAVLVLSQRPSAYDVIGDHMNPGR